ncbi:MAG: DNA polymerase I [Planctomycetaceae bacterium]|jgi:DNA polymerase-1|nr:DNA polymerase I [Planctomycetaceae bacterium]
MSETKTVYILDSHGLLYQLFHALPPMTSPQGEPVGALYGFTREIFNIIEKQRPDYLFCAFDKHAPTFRSEIYADYKANRSAMPEDLRPQIETAQEILAAFNIPVLAMDGYEADDIMATLCAAESAAKQITLVSSDKDLRQLISENVSLYSPRKGAFYKTEDLLNDWGITPQQVVDYQSLVGDSTDNVPGVAKIGQKTATELLQQFGTLEGIYDNVNEITGKKKEYLIAGKDNAFLSRQLVKLKGDVPVQIEWREYTGFDTETLRALLQRFGFKSLMEKLTIPLTVDGKPSTANNVVYHLVDTAKAFDEFLTQLIAQKEFAFDTETAPLEPRFEATMPRYTVPVGLSFAWNDAEAFYLPFRGPLGANVLKQELVLEKLRPVFENPNVGKIGQNIKYDSVVLRNAADIKVNGIVFDTMLADYVLHPDETHNLDDLAQRYLNHTTIKIDKLIGTGKKQKRMDEVQTDVIAEYAGEDALIAWKLYKHLAPAACGRLFNIELPLVYALTEMEVAGITVNADVLKRLGQKLSEQLETLEEEIYELAGHQFNVASPKQLGVVLFDELGLKTVRKTKTGQSTDIEVLEELASEHPLPEKIVRHRTLSKLKGTYVDALPLLIHPKTGRIHTSFNQIVTATGRLSSSNPNLQNIPVRTAEGKEIRNAFRPGAGFDYLLSCDYSQIELRVLAHFSQDETLCEAFRNGEDIHARVAQELFGISGGTCPADARRAAKAVNFGVIYGQTAFGLSKQLGIDQKEAQKFIDTYFERYSGIRAYLDSILDNGIVNGYVETLYGHRRYFRQDTIRKERKGSLNQAERMAVNTVIQGTAADLMKQAMVRLQSSAGYRLLLQIHDELVFEVKAECAEELERTVIETMELGQPLRVPLVVDAELDKHWN